MRAPVIIGFALVGLIGLPLRTYLSALREAESADSF